jgi:sterol desaturase/sphingolipid hydroxylase (fatty acid hydroxylase superfamily)
MSVLAGYRQTFRQSFLKWRTNAFSRDRSDWIVDLSGLAVQGVLVPLAQTFFVLALCMQVAPGYKGVLALPAWTAFVLNFVFVDYAYYWNHRAFHARALWKVHRTHHEGEIVDFFTTSRNVLWAPVLIVYLWLNGICVFLLGDAAPFLWAIGLTTSLDLWRHSKLAPRPGSSAHQFLSRVLITPLEHHAHHGAGSDGLNFGANLSLWDRIHGTYRVARDWPKTYGTGEEKRPVWRRLLIP